jgi:hypothetical protein
MDIVIHPWHFLMCKTMHIAGIPLPQRFHSFHISRYSYGIAGDSLQCQFSSFANVGLFRYRSIKRKSGAASGHFSSPDPFVSRLIVRNDFTGSLGV